MKRQRGLTLIELSLVLAAMAVITASTLAGLRALNQRNEVRELSAQILQLQEIVSNQAAAGGDINIGALANSGQIPDGWLRGTPGAYTVVNAAKGNFTVATGTQSAAPSGRVLVVTATGVRPEVCSAVVAVIQGAFDEVYRAPAGGPATYIKRANTASNVPYTVAGAEAACAVANSNLNVAWRVQS